MQNDDFERGLICPSFNSYSSDKLADVAAKVCREFDHLKLLDESNKDDDDDFEFVSFKKSADEVFLDDNQIGPVFPVFNRDLIFDKSLRDLPEKEDDDEDEDKGSVAALPSSSSSDVEELMAVPPGTYCLWKPKPTATKCKKSKSTGTSSSRRWSLKDLLRRSNSESGKDSLVILTPLPTSSSKKVEDNKSSRSGSGGPKPKAAVNSKGQNAVSVAHEAFYVRNKAVAKDGYNKRRSYLPYRQDLGFFASVNVMSGTFPAL